MYGVVQGVGYRAFTQSVAGRLGLYGYVRNCPDGSVEVIAEGEDAPLKQLLEALWRGPIGARVQHVETSYTDATGEYTHFEIRR